MLDFVVRLEKVQKCVVQHMSDIKQAVNAFNTCGPKPTALPFELTWDLLKYNFINVELIHAYNLAKKSRTKIYNSDEKTGLMSQKSDQYHSTTLVTGTRLPRHFGKLIQQLIDWLKNTSISTLITFCHLLKIAQDILETAEWEAIRDYKVKMCLQFSARPWLMFKEFNQIEFNHIKN